MYQVSRLRNGLTVATAAMPHMASVSLGLWVGAGGRHEPAELNGISHFIEHLLFKGTRRRSAKQISQDVEGIGGYLNAFTSEENTCFYSRARHDHFAGLLEVLTDMFLNSRCTPDDISKERNVIKEELAMYLDQPHLHVQEILNESMWPNQPLGRSLTGTEPSLDGLKRPHFLKYLRSHYVSGSTLITASGNIEHQHVVQAVRKIAPRFTPGPRPGFLPATSTQNQPVVRLLTKSTEQTQLALGFRTCSRHDERRFALRLLNTLLGENMSSRLFQVVREDRGLAYSIHSSISFFEDVGDLVISAGLDTNKLNATLKLVLRELRRLATTPPTAAEMRRTRDYVLGQFDLSLESTENQMMWLGEQLLGYGCIVSPAEIKRRLSLVSATEIRNAARDFFQPNRLNLALISPLKNNRTLQPLLV